MNETVKEEGKKKKQSRKSHKKRSAKTGTRRDDPIGFKSEAHLLRMCWSMRERSKTKGNKRK
jgi:hypothetical protein